MQVGHSFSDESPPARQKTFKKSAEGLVAYGAAQFITYYHLYLSYVSLPLFPNKNFCLITSFTCIPLILLWFIENTFH